jgi:myo-inositol-1(or 4)-monophosphatase
VAQQAALAAGKLMLERVNTELTINTKSSRVDLVTDVDVACDTLIRKIISDAFPEHLLLTEETYEEGQLDALFTSEQNQPEWIVDPIDGTTNFAHGYPYSSVSIGMMQNGEIKVGVIYDPYHDEMFYAEKGGHAYLNNQPIQVSTVTSVADSLIATGFAFRREANAAYQQKVSQLMRVLEASHDIRRVGSAAIDLAYVACGRQEAFYESHLAPWDVAAGWLILECAGGIITKFDNSTLSFKQKQQDIVASNSHLHTELLTLLNQ